MLQQEAHTNDVAGNAGTNSNLPVYGSVSGTLPLGDRDWYRVYLEAGRTYTIMMSDRDDPSLAGDFPYDTWVRLYNAAGKYLASGTEDGGVSNDDSQLVYKPSYTGIYYVEARGSVYATGTGSYTLELLAQGSSTDIPDTTLTTQRLLLRTPFSSSVDLPTDVDWLQVDLEAGVNYAINAGATTLPHLNLDLYNQAGNYLRTISSHDVFSVASQGTHYVGVSSSNRAEVGDYTLELFRPAALLSIEGGYSSTQSTARENDGSIKFTVRLSNAVGAGVSVRLSNTGTDTAMVGQDFPAIDQLVVFAPGETVKEVSIPITNDTLGEPAETFQLYLSAPSGGVGLANKLAAAYIFDDDFKVPKVNGVGLFDPYTMYQWYLYPGTGANVVEAWKSYTGKGVTVAVFDQGIDPTQPDLDGNLRLDLSRIAGTLAPGGAPIYAGDNHGTAVAGVIAAERNGINVTGAAFDAQLVSIYTSFGNGPENWEAVNRNAFTYATNFDILNDSWGFAPRQAYQALDYDWAFLDNFRTAAFDAQGKALKALAETGRQGLGTVVVQAAGNSYSIGDDTNLHNYQNSRYIITVAATDYLGDVTSYSSPGSSVLIAAPGGGGNGGLSDIFTTDRSGAAGYAGGDWTTIVGTSFSAPLVSGVVALMLEANPSLGFRDVQTILAYSARITSVPSNQWAYNGAHDWNGAGLHFDANTHNLGFGLVDALAAVRLAETWRGDPATAANDVELTTVNHAPVAIPDANVVGVTQTIHETRAITVERVEVTVDILHTYIGDLGILLTSPAGTESWLIYKPGTNELAPFGQDQDQIDFTFNTVLNLGESSLGDWKLTVVDLATLDAGELRSWTLNLIGKPVTQNNVFTYTNEFNESRDAATNRAVLTDASGRDTFNAAAVSTSSSIDLAPGGSSIIDGRSLQIAADTLIEDAYGGDGDDTIRGNTVANLLYGMRGNDQLSGGGGEDLLYGGVGDDSLHGDGGQDTLYGEVGNDSLYGDEGDDTLYGGAEADTVYGGGGFDVLHGDDGDDTLDGGADADRFEGEAGNDLLKGGDGIDAAWYSANRSNYALNLTGAGYTLADRSGLTGSDTLSEVERLRFADTSVALDVAPTQSAGQTALLIGAVLGHAALETKKPLVGAVLSLMDQGYTFQALSGAVMRLDIWGVLANGGNPTASNTQIANYLLTTVNRAAPDAATLNAAVTALNNQTNAALGQGDFLWHLAESTANQQQVGLVGLATTGLEFSLGLPGEGDG